jgi:hypothetical protein
MPNLTCNRKLHSVALVVAGWLCFFAAIVTGNPILKVAFLVAARALPHVLTCVIRAAPDVSPEPLCCSGS